MRLFRHELRYELLLYSRSRELAFFTFLLPMILFLLLGFAYGDEEIQGVKGSDYLLTGTLGYGVVATAFAGLAIVLVIRREEGILKRLRSTPLPAPTYLVAVLVTTMVAFLILSPHPSNPPTTKLALLTSFLSSSPASYCSSFIAVK